MFIRMCFVVVNYVRKVPSLVVITGTLSCQVGGRLCPPVTWGLVFFHVLVQHAQGHFQVLHVGIEATVWACLGIRKERMLAQPQILHEQPTGYW